MGMKKQWSLSEAIEAQREMVREDIGTALELFEEGRYEEATIDLGAAIGEMGALAAYQTIEANKVKPS